MPYLTTIEKENLKSSVLSRLTNTERQEYPYYQAIYELLLELETDVLLSITQKEEVWVLTQQLYDRKISSEIYLKSASQIVAPHRNAQATLSLCYGMLLGLGTTTLIGHFSLFNAGVCSIFFTAIINTNLRPSVSNIQKKLFQIELMAKNQPQTSDESSFIHAANTTEQHLTKSNGSESLADSKHSTVSSIYSSQSRLEKKSRQFLKDLSHGLFFKPNITGSDIEKDVWSCLDALCEKTSGHKLFTPNRTGTELEKQARRFMSNFR